MVVLWNSSIWSQPNPNLNFKSINDFARKNNILKRKKIRTLKVVDVREGLTSIVSIPEEFITRFEGSN